MWVVGSTGLEQDEPWLHGTRHTLREITPTWSRRLKDEIHDLDAVWFISQDLTIFGGGWS